MIPKIIHLCWLSGDAYPTKIAKCIDSWKRFLPDYEIMLWDTHRFPLSQSDWVREAYECKKYAFAADYIRFYALYHHGGIYLDSDVEILRSLDDLLSRPYFMGTEKAGTIEAAVMGAELGAEWAKRCLDYYEGRHFLQQDGSMDIRKLPEIMVEVLKDWKPMRVLTTDEAKHMTPNDYEKDLLVLPDDYFSPKVFDSREVLITPQTYAIHHYSNSWFSPKAKAYYRTRSLLIRILGYKVVRKLECTLFPNKFK
jgi:mannosyltransferase OCH1-like enzyme